MRFVFEVLLLTQIISWLGMSPLMKSVWSSFLISQVAILMRRNLFVSIDAVAILKACRHSDWRKSRWFATMLWLQFLTVSEFKEKYHRCFVMLSNVVFVSDHCRCDFFCKPRWNLIELTCIVASSWKQLFWKSFCEMKFIVVLKFCWWSAVVNYVCWKFIRWWWCLRLIEWILLQCHRWVLSFVWKMTVSRHVFQLSLLSPLVKCDF